MNISKELSNLAEAKGTVDSRAVALMFNKPHNYVLKFIDRTEFSGDFRQNYLESSYIDAQGKKRRQILMTRVGFMYVAMSTKGREAAPVKEAIIDEFNRMEREILSKWAPGSRVHVVATPLQVGLDLRVWPEAPTR